MIGPLARYAIRKCCDSDDHITNFEDSTYIQDMKDDIKRVGKQLKSLVHLRRLKNAKVLNPLVLMGIVGPEAAPADELMWGRDPVHPKRSAYETMAARVLDEIGSSTVRHPKRPSDNTTQMGPEYGSRQRGRMTGSSWSREAGPVAPKHLLRDGMTPTAIGQSTLDTAVEPDTSTTRNLTGGDKSVCPCYPCSHKTVLFF